MYSYIMIYELVDAVQRDRGIPGPSHKGWSNGSYQVERRGALTGVKGAIGGALVRAGRSLQGGAAPRPEPVGS